MNRRQSTLNAVLGAVLAVSTCATAQQQGAIDFMVVDPSGAAVPQARISIVDGKRKLAEGKANERGALSLSGLPEGQHLYKIKSRGFGTYSGAITVLPDQRIRVDAKLRLSHGDIKVTEVD